MFQEEILGGQRTGKHPGRVPSLCVTLSRILPLSLSMSHRFFTAKRENFQGKEASPGVLESWAGEITDNCKLESMGQSVVVARSGHGWDVHGMFP